MKGKDERLGGAAEIILPVQEETAVTEDKETLRRRKTKILRKMEEKEGLRVRYVSRAEETDKAQWERGGFRVIRVERAFYYIIN